MSRYPHYYDMQMEMHADREIWPEWGGAVRGDMIQPHWAHPGEAMGIVAGVDPATRKQRAYHILRCAWCIATHVWPLPSPESLMCYYAEEFYEHEKPDYLERYHKDREWWKACVHRPLITKAESFLTDMPDGPPRMRQMLEVGAGPGMALDVAAHMGWGTHAIEPSPLCARELYQRGHQVWEGTLENFCACIPTRNYFDLVYLYEVVEHQPCPEDFLLRCYELLIPGGMLVVAVPNDGNPLQYQVCTKLGIDPYWYAPPQHLFYFTPKTLQLLLKRTGFVIRDARGTYPMEQFILDGQNYLGNDAIGRKVHQWRMQEEMFTVQSGLWVGRE